jgi:hypothetical protein
MQIRGNFSDFFFETALPALRTVIGREWAEYPEMYSQVLRVESSDRSIEQTSQVSGVRLLSEIGEGESITTDNIIQGFDKTFRHSKFGLAVPTTQEMIDDDKFRLVTESHQGLARSTKETIEIQGASILNNAFSTVTGPDGKVLCASDHPLIKNGGTQANLASVSADLDFVSLSLALADMELMKDSAGLLQIIPAKRLVVATANRLMAAEITKSADRPDTANRATNALKYARDGMPEVMVYPYLTDPDAWFLMAPAKQTKLYWFWRKRPYTKSWFNDEREVGYVGTRYRASYGFADWQGVWGNPGA